MRQNVKIVIGANFGDEGKGLMTDFFCDQESWHSDKILNVRFNGGSQAGHTVELSNGERHIFSHFGSGTFAGADTYLTEDFIVNPIMFVRELGELRRMGYTPRIFAHKGCRVTIPQDMMINQIVEQRRSNRHGSCGVGIFETIVRDRSGLLGDDYTNARLLELGIANLTKEEEDLLNNVDIMNKFREDYRETFDNIILISDERFFYKQYQIIVFEGAQGLLLDMDNEEYFPNLTPSNTGLGKMDSILKHLENPLIEVCYVTRTYFTRHGAGKFNTEATKEEVIGKYAPIDVTNRPNEFQGSLRYGYFDYDLFTETVEKDSRKLTSLPFQISLAVTHCNITKDSVVGKYIDIDVKDIENLFMNDVHIDTVYKVLGRTRENVKYA